MADNETKITEQVVITTDTTQAQKAIKDLQKAADEANQSIQKSTKTLDKSLSKTEKRLKNKYLSNRFKGHSLFIYTPPPVFSKP